MSVGTARGRQIAHVGGEIETAGFAAVSGIGHLYHMRAFRPGIAQIVQIAMALIVAVAASAAAWALAAPIVASANFHSRFRKFFQGENLFLSCW